MVCINCGNLRHNNASSVCPTNMIIRNFNSISEFTFSPMYLRRGLDWLNLLYPNKFCTSIGKYLTYVDGVISYDPSIFISICSMECEFNYIVLPLNLDNIHLNVVLIDFLKGTITRYDPWGWNASTKVDLDLRAFTKNINSCLNRKFIYIPVIVSCPNLGPQITGNDPIGMCQTYCIYEIERIISGNIGTQNPNFQSIIRYSSRILTFIYLGIERIGVKKAFLEYNSLPECMRNCIQESV